MFLKVRTNRLLFVFSTLTTKMLRCRLTGACTASLVALPCASLPSSPCSLPSFLSKQCFPSLWHNGACPKKLTASHQQSTNITHFRIFRKYWNFGAAINNYTQAYSPDLKPFQYTTQGIAQNTFRYRTSI